jgi:hypothetical protein
MRVIMRGLAAVALAIAALSLLYGTAEAHERREVGNYVLVVGFLNEPAYVEAPNGASITVFRKDGTPVEGVERTLKVEITTGGASRTFDLQRVFGQQGAYRAVFIPTKTGTYVFRFFGKIENLDVNERFESGPNRFDDVVGTADLQFPVKVPTNGELAAQLESPRPAGQPAAAGGDVQRALARADSARRTGILVGGAGIVVGLAGVVLAVVALRSRGGTGGGSGPSVATGGEVRDGGARKHEPV